MSYGRDPRGTRLRPMVLCRALFTPRRSLLLITFTVIVVAGLFAYRWLS